MADPLTLIVLVAAGEGSDPTTNAMLRATRSALSDSHVQVREMPSVSNDADALTMERGAHADAVVEVAWIDSGHRHVTLRVHVASSGRWIDRSIGFASSDADSERGRTLGYAVASMLPDWIPPSPAPSPPSATGSSAPTPPPPALPGPPSPSASSPQPPPPPLPVPSTAAPSPPVAPAPSAPSGEPTSPDRIAPPAEQAGGRTSVFQLDVTGLGATGVDGGLEYGGGAAARWFVLPRVSVRLGGGARTGSVPAADASLLTLLATAGVALHPWRATASHPLGMSVRVDYLLANQQMTHFSGDEPAPVTISRWLSGLDGLVEGQWFFARDIGLIAGVGAEDVFGTTTVSMRGPLVASIPPLRGVGEIGLLISF